MGAADPRHEAELQLRASDEERERAAERLRVAATRGQLDIDELDERLSAAFASRMRGELDALTADLPDPIEDPLAAAGPGRPVVRTGEGGEAWIVSVMSGHERKGSWRLASRVRVVNVMGGSDLDLTQAELSAATTEFTVVSIMGGSEIRVPHGVRVHATRFAFMGGNKVELGAERAPDEAPVLRVRLFALMGGNELRRGAKKPRKHQREERERRGLEDSES